MKDDSDLEELRETVKANTVISQDDSAISSPSSGVSSPLFYDKDIEDRVNHLITKHNLESLYVAQREFAPEFKDDSRKYWIEAEEWKKQKSKEEERRRVKTEEFKDVYTTRLYDLYRDKYEELQKGKPTLNSNQIFERLTQSGLDENIVEAFKERCDAHKRVANQKDIEEHVGRQLGGKGPSMVDKMVDSHKHQQGTSFGPHVGGDLKMNVRANDPRSQELRWMQGNSDRFRKQKNICDRNFENVLSKGESLGNVAYSEADTIKSNIGAKGMAKSMGQGAAKSAFDFVNNLANSGKGRHQNIARGKSSYGLGDPDRESLANWSDYRKLKEKENNLANSMAGSLAFINEKSLNKLKSILASVQGTARDNLSLEDKNYLDAYEKEIGNNINSLEKVLEQEKNNLDNRTKDLAEGTDAQMQNAMEDKNARLKWNILCMLLMASPFTQGLMVAGPLFDYLSFLGDILGPIFMNEDGFAAGFAQALENFPIFGEFIKWIQFSDVFETVLNETPFLNSFTGKEGIIDGLTRNEIFTGIVETCNFEYLSIAGMAAGGAYLFASNYNAHYGDNKSATNSKTSIKTIKDEHMENLKKIFTDAAEKSSKIDDDQAAKYNKSLTRLNRDFFKKSIIAQTLDESIDNSVKNGKIDDLLKIFEGIEIFGQDDAKNDKVQKLKTYISEQGLKDGSEFSKRATVFSDEVLKNSDMSYGEIGKTIKEGETTYKMADNNFGMRFFEKEMKELDLPTAKLSEMALANELGEVAEATKMIDGLDQNIADRRTAIDKELGRSFVPSTTTKNKFDYAKTPVGVSAKQVSSGAAAAA